MIFREAAETGAGLTVLLAALAVMRVAPRLGLMPDYELYPAPPRHPLLTDVHWAAVIGTLLAGTAAVWIVRIWKRMVWPKGQDYARTAGIAVAPLWLLLVSLITLVYNPIGAVTFLVLPALLWIWLRPAATRPGRVLAGIVVGAGFLVVIRLLQQYGSSLQIGWHILWYVFMGIAYGQFALPPILLAFATIAIGARLLVLTALAR